LLGLMNLILLPFKLGLLLLLFLNAGLLSETLGFFPLFGFFLQFFQTFFFCLGCLSFKLGLLFLQASLHSETLGFFPLFSFFFQFFFGFLTLLLLSLSLKFLFK
jgi:hypothetical protein